MELQEFQTQLDIFNSKLGIVINWIEDVNLIHEVNLCHEGRFGVDIRLKSSQELMDEILLFPNSTLCLNAYLYKNPNEIGIKDYSIKFSFLL